MSLARSIRSSRRTQVPGPSSVQDIGHFIYCVNFYDNGLKAVQEEFVKRVTSGTRRAVFVIDLKKEILASTMHNERFSRSRKTLGRYSYSYLLQYLTRLETIQDR